MPRSPLTAHLSRFRPPAISQLTWRQATVTCTGLFAGVISCGGRAPVSSSSAPVATVPRTLPLSRVIVLETSGPPPSDTSVTFTAGQERMIVLRHGPPENIVFARLTFL